MVLSEIFNDIDFYLIQGNLNINIVDIVYNSKEAKPGSIFVCISGNVLDGHDFIKEAYELGAVAVVTLIRENISIPNSMTHIAVDDTRETLSYMSAAFFDYPMKELKTIAITGTKGKTTTSFLIKNILENSGYKVCLIGTMGAFCGSKQIKTKNTTPESYDIQKIARDAVEFDSDFLILEVSSQAVMQKRISGLTFNYGIYTNISPDHIGTNEHNSYNEYVFYKSLLFSQCICGIFNLDDKHVKDMMMMCKGHKITYSVDSNSNYRAVNISLVKPMGISFQLKKLNESFYFSMPGKYSVYNALAAIATSLQIGCNVNVLKYSLENTYVKGRSQTFHTHDGYTIMIDYAHNAVSVREILNAVRCYGYSRITTVFGCGGNRAKQRRYEMGEVSGRLADLTIITSDNSRFENVEDIIHDIETGIKKTSGQYIILPDRKDAIRYSIDNAIEGELIILLGKGHEDYQETAGIKHPFDESIIIEEILKEKECQNAGNMQI